MKLEFYIIDVFAEGKYAGNQLAVFRNASELTTEQMLTLAKEINFQESTFIIHEDEENSIAKVRIFTPELEMVFAGHPTIGTAWIVLNKIFQTSKNKIILDLPVGNIPVENNNEILWFTAAKPTFFEIYKREDISEFTNLQPSQISPKYPIQRVSTGSVFFIVPLENTKDLETLEINLNQLKNWMISRKVDQKFCAFYFFCEDKNQIKTRMIQARMLFVENKVLKEDAATGSAASCLLAYLLEYQKSEIETTIHQGEYINRPSKIYLKGKKENENYAIQIGGKVQFIAKGEWEV